MTIINIYFFIIITDKKVEILEVKNYHVKQIYDTEEFIYMSYINPEK